MKPKGHKAGCRCIVCGRRSNGKRTVRKNTHLPVGTGVSYKGHPARVVKQHAGDKYTIAFQSGTKMLVAGRSLKRANGLAIKANPWLAFKHHGGKAEKVTFFAKTTRATKAKRLDERPAGYAFVGRAEVVEKPAKRPARKPAAKRSKK